MAQIFVRFLYAQPFSIYKVVENWKYQKSTKRHQTDLELLAVKSIPYTLSRCPRDPNFGLFFSMTSRLLRYKVVENRKKALNNLRITLDTLAVKNTLHTVSTWYMTSSFEDIAHLLILDGLPC